MLCFYHRYHPFDDHSRRRRKPKRKKVGDVHRPELPARGAQPIREFHRRDESKIFPHVREGLT